MLLRPTFHQFCKIGSKLSRDGFLKTKINHQRIQTKTFSFQNNGFKGQLKSSRKMYLLTAGAVSCIAGIAMTNHIKEQFVVSAASDDKGRPYIKPSSSVHIDTDHSGLKLTLFQYTTCPFCCKVRATLDYHGFSYDIVEVNSVSRSQIKWSKYRKVPILVCDGVGPDGYMQMNDSSVIMSMLATYLLDPKQPLDRLLAFYPGHETKNDRGRTVMEYPNKYFVMHQGLLPESQMVQSKNERNWRSWTDDVLLHMLAPNTYRTPSESVRAFKHYSKVGEWESSFSMPERVCMIYVGAAVMFIIGKYLKKKYNLKDDVRQSLYDACNEWLRAVGPDQKYLGGDLPCLADLTVYGYLNSIEGCDSFNDLLKNTEIGPWYDQIKKLVKNQAGAHPLNRK